MNYVVRMILTALLHDTESKVRESTAFRYLPAFNREDAEHMAEMLSKSRHLHQEGGTRLRRNFDVCGVVYNGKGNVYLDVATLEQIANEYTRPEKAA